MKINRKNSWNESVWSIETGATQFWFFYEKNERDKAREYSAALGGQEMCRVMFSHIRL